MLTLVARRSRVPADGWGDGKGFGNGDGAGAMDDSPDGDGAIWFGGSDGDGYGESEQNIGALGHMLVEAGVEKLYLLAQVLNNQGE